MYLTNLPNLSATERVTICTQFKYGCCEVEEAIIPAQGPNQSGCPSACKCHVLGKFFFHIMPLTFYGFYEFKKKNVGLRYMRLFYVYSAE